MDSLHRSGLYYPNNLARIILVALEEVIGLNGVNALLRLANKDEFIGNLPPDNMNPEVDFADFSMIFGALDEMYGARGSRALSLRAGIATFDETLKNLGEAVDVHDSYFTSLPVDEKIRVGISVVGITFFQSTRNLPVVREENDHFTYSIKNCPICWQRITPQPSCHMFTGILKGAIRWVTLGADWEVTQSTARSCGAHSCDFKIPKFLPR